MLKNVWRELKYHSFSELKFTENAMDQSNGFKGRKNTLVSDAKSETARNKSEKESYIQDFKTDGPQEFDFKEEVDKDHSNGFNGRRSSLVTDAKLETARNKVAQESWIKDLKKDGTQDFDLTEEEVLLLSQVQSDGNNDKIKAHLIFSICEGLSTLPRILKFIEMFEAHVEYLETRQSRKNHLSFDVLVKLFVKRKGLLNLIKSVRQSDDISVTVIANEQLYFKDVWFPKHINELDNCTHVLSKFEPDLDSSHPGFSDAVYRARRREIAEIAFQYKQGQPIPQVDYTDEEIKTWGIVYKKMYSLHSKYACSAYQNMFSQLEKECQYGPDSIPQLQDVSKFLKKTSGFSLRPAAGLVSARDFLSSLAFRVFQCTQYTRHSSSPHHSPEPDCIHELLGHVPMLADPAFARFSQEIGLSSLGASDEDIEKLATIYWFTVEFGLCKENGGIKAYGAGLLSSYGELLHALSGKPQLLPFEPETTAVEPYQDLHYQSVYFVAESFDEAKDKIRNYVNLRLQRQYDIIYDPYTESIKEINSLDKLESVTQTITSELLTLTSAIRHLKYI